MKALFITALLLAGPAAATPPAAVPEFKDPGDKVEKLICKRSTEVGSLVKTKKVCMTRAQWQQSAERHQDYGRDLQDGLRTKPCTVEALCN